MAAAIATKTRSFSELDEVFQKRACECFTKRFAAKINPLACPIYRDDTIEAVLHDMIGDMTFGEIKNVYPKLSVIIPALDLTRDQYIVFDNIRGKYDDVKLYDAARFTSAAPSYFSGKEWRGRVICDGGVIEVAPLLTTTTSIKKNFGIPFCNMSILMLDCGQDLDKHPLTPKSYNKLGMLGIATEVLVPYVTLSNSMATKYWGDQMGYGYFNYFNPCIVDTPLDDVKSIPDDVAQTEKYRADFLQAWDEWMNS